MLWGEEKAAKTTKQSGAFLLCNHMLSARVSVVTALSSNPKHVKPARMVGQDNDSRTDSPQRVRLAGLGRKV